MSHISCSEKPSLVITSPANILELVHSLCGSVPANIAAKSAVSKTDMLVLVRQESGTTKVVSINLPVKSKAANRIPQQEINLAPPTKQLKDMKVVPLDPSVLVPKTKKEVLELVRQCVPKLAAIHQISIGNPLLKYLESPASDLMFRSALVQDAIGAVIQSGQYYNPKATRAFQEITSDLYQGFLAKEDSSGVPNPVLQRNPPIIKWGVDKGEIYTWPADSTELIPGVTTSIVVFPVAFADSGIAAYTALGHETCGHDILHADVGLLPDIREHIKEKIRPDWLCQYWQQVLDDGASDVLGILSVGPMAGLGLIILFDGWFGGLRNYQVPGDVHPMDILRGYLAAQVVRMLNFSDREFWASKIEQKTDFILATEGNVVKFDGRVIKFNQNPKTEEELQVRQSIQTFAEIVMAGKMKTLDNKSLAQIDNWEDSDEDIVDEIRAKYFGDCINTDPFPEGYYAAHAVAAGTKEAILSPKSQKDLDRVFLQMVTLLAEMNKTNPYFQGAPKKRYFRAV
eukprot:TRINITY_DN2755_c0_g1_i1.p1 TRINITY_DN2755_c0_g1~~TRINITY_DN2755_c0_g1_i1.p1  ORF type:complete len:603 (+),score=217.60 TRINITY_DN2755_c0_g1_i1:272-1810(+)